VDFLHLHLDVYPDVWPFALQLSRDLSIWLVIDPGGMYICMIYIYMYASIYICFQANTTAVKIP